MGGEVMGRYTTCSGDSDDVNDGDDHCRSVSDYR